MKHETSLRSYSVKSDSKGPTVVETGVALIIGFGGFAYMAYNLYSIAKPFFG